MAGELIPLVAAIIAIGVGAQVLANRFGIPSIIFFLVAGVALGPEGAGIVTRQSFGHALPAIVGLSVAIIVFEGAFHLKLSKLREAPQSALRLVTVGAIISLVGTAVAVRYALDTRWDIAFLVGSLLIATGPTVISPILKVVPVRDNVAAALETEGIVNDVTAAILSVAVFEIVIAENSGTSLLVQGFTKRLATGVLVGIVVAGVLWYLLNHVDLSSGNAPQNARLLVLAGALVSFGFADAVESEAGVAAVAVSGILLGNMDIPYKEDIESFKGDITLVVLSFVFIALAALLEFQDLLALGLPGIAVVVVVALLVRPALVFLSTVGDRFTFEERVFMSFVGPRGIIPASVATLFAVSLQNQGFDQAASLLVGTVFLVIFATVVFEGGFARHLAEYLDVIPMRVIIVGGGQVGLALADRLEDRGENVIVVERDVDAVEAARNAGHTVHIGDGTDMDTLRSAGAENAKIVVAATGDDDANLLVSQLASSSFDPETIIARANKPDNVKAFEELGVRTIASSIATAQAIDNAIERPALSQWMGELGQSGDVQEVEVTNDELAGRSVREVGPELPAGCLVALVARDGETLVPGADFEFQRGDRVTLIGQRDAVRAAMRVCHPDQ